MDIGEVEICRVGYRLGKGENLNDLALATAAEFKGETIGGVIAATFSGTRRFPALSVEIASMLGLGGEMPAFDLQLACSAYPYAVYLAGKISADVGKPVLVVDGDVQSRLVDATDHATGTIFSDAVTGTLVRGKKTGLSRFAFLSRYDEALKCDEVGPIKMDGMKVFTFVATEVSAWLKQLVGMTPLMAIDYFAPHQANPYMIRQLAKSLGMQEKLLTIPDEVKNPGSSSVALTLAMNQAKIAKESQVLIAGFGAGYSAAAGIVKVNW